VIYAVNWPKRMIPSLKRFHSTDTIHPDRECLIEKISAWSAVFFLHPTWRARPSQQTSRADHVVSANAAAKDIPLLVRPT